MELTPQELREVEFRERWRGYDPDDVDDFLEKAAVALEELHARLREYRDRAVDAEQRVSEGAQTEGALRHTLVLAQRTAESAVAEAQETAARILRDAEERARAMVGEARIDADRAAEESQRQLRNDVLLLETAKVQLQADIDALEHYLTEERAHVRSSLTELMWRLEERVSGGLSPRPEMRDPFIPPLPGAASVSVPPAVRAVPPPAPESPPDIAAVAPAPAALPDAGEGPLRAPRLVYKRASGDDGPTDAAPLFDDEAGDDDGFAPQESEVIQWPGKKHPPLPADDDFFEALRSALDDDAPLGPRDDAPLPLEPNDAGNEDAAPPEGRSGSRFRRRR